MRRLKTIISRRWKCIKTICRRRYRNNKTKWMFVVIISYLHEELLIQMKCTELYANTFVFFLLRLIVHFIIEIFYSSVHTWIEEKKCYRHELDKCNFSCEKFLFHVLAYLPMETTNTVRFVDKCVWRSGIDKTANNEMQRKVFGMWFSCSETRLIFSIKVFLFHFIHFYSVLLFLFEK